MGDSRTINVIVYALFVGSLKVKVKPFTLVVYWIVECVTQEVKIKL